MKRYTALFFLAFVPFATRPIITADSHNEMAHYRQIAERPIATVQDLVDLILMTRGDYAKYPNEAKRLAEARSEGLIKHQQAHDALDRGTLAFAILKGFNVSRGLLFRLTQWNRYALRDVQEAGILAYRYSENNPVSGEQLIGAIGAAEEYRAEKEKWSSNH